KPLSAPRYRSGSVLNASCTSASADTGAQATGIVGLYGLRSRTVRKISLHDSRSGRVQILQPRDAGKVGIYACGPTVYSRIHVGNARPFVVFSLLKRFLQHEGLEAVLVANVT